MNSEYDEWYSDNAPCSTESSRKSSSACCRTLKSGWSVAPWRSMLMWIVFAFVVVALAFASGCGSRAVFIPDQSPVRVGPGVKGRVWMLVDGDWTLSSNSVELPEGMYIVPPRFVEEGEP